MLKNLYAGVLLVLLCLSGPVVTSAQSINAVVDTPGSALDVAISEHYAYVADKNGGLQIIDVSDPAQPQPVASVTTPGAANSVAVYGSYALVADGMAGVQIYNISNPLAPQPYAELSVAGTATDIAVVGTTAYVAAGSGGLSIINLQDMLAPYSMGVCTLPGTAQMVTMIDDVAYVAAGSGGLQLVDVGNPYDPTVIGQLATGSARWLSVAGDIVFLAGADGKLLSVDASDPSEPAIVQSRVPAGVARAVEVVDDLAFVADQNNGLRILSIGEVLPGKVTSPNGGEFYAIGQMVQVKWQPIEQAQSYALKYSLGDGQWIDLATATSGSSDYSWHIPSVSQPKNSCRVRVQALGAGGQVVGDDVSDGVFTISFSAGTVAGVSSPATSTSSTITVSWSASSVSGVQYQLQLSKDGGAYESVYQGSSRSIALAGLANGSYKFRARATKASYIDGPWSPLSSTTVASTDAGNDGPACAMPGGITVPGQTTAGTIPVSWTASSTSGVTYRVEKSTDSGGSWSTVYSGSGLSTTVSVNSEGAYRFRVKAMKSGLADSSWLSSTNCQADLGIPGPLSVPATSSNGAIALSWGASNTPGVSYVVEISSDAGTSYALISLGDGLLVPVPIQTGSFVEVYQGEGQSGTIHISTNGTYTFRIKATKDNYTDSSWIYGGSCDVTLKCAQPATIEPAPFYNKLQFAVIWDQSAISEPTYVLEMSSDGGATFTQVYSGGSYVTLVPVPNVGSYIFRVKATKSGLLDSGWTVSDPMTITIPTDAVSIIKPVSGSTDSDGTFDVTWRPSQHTNATYIVQEATNSSFTAGLRTIASYTSGTSVTITGREDYTTYYYRVRVSVPGIPDGSWSHASSVTIEYPNLGVQLARTCPRCTTNFRHGSGTVGFNASAFPEGTIFTIIQGNQFKVQSGEVLVRASSDWSFILSAAHPFYRGTSQLKVSGDYRGNSDGDHGATP